MYVCPAIKAVRVEMENLMQSASGQHSEIGNGGTIGTAKENIFDDDDEMASPTNNTWGDRR